MDEKPVLRQDQVHVNSPSRGGEGHGHGVFLAPQSTAHGNGQHGIKQPRFAVTPAKLRDALFYRWKLALLTGLILAFVGAGIAWATYKPKYTATATIRMTSSKDRLLPGGPEETGRGNREDGFQKIQAQIIKGRTLLGNSLTQGGLRGLTTFRNMEDPVLWLEKELQAGFLPGTDIFRIWLSGEDPQDLALIVNAITKHYLEDNGKFSERQQAYHLESIEKVMAAAEAKVRTKREDLDRLAKTYKTGDTALLTLKQKMTIEDSWTMKRELSSIEGDMRKTIALLSVQEAELNAAKESQEKGLDIEKFSPGLVDDYLDAHLEVQKAKQDIAKLEVQIKEYRKTATPESAGLKKLEDELEKAQAHVQKARAEVQPDVLKKIRAAVSRQRENNIQQAKEKLKILKEQHAVVDERVGELVRDGDKIGLGRFDIETLRNDIEATESTLKSLRGVKERLEIEKSNKNDVVIAKHDAEVPTVNQASLLKTGGLYWLAGLVLGLLGVSFIEARFHRLHKAATLHQELGIQTLGVLPLLARKKGGTYGTPLAARDSMPGMLFTDAVDGICARLLCDDRLSHNSVIMVTSSSEDEGKTTLATQLALGLARSGRRTLLLDCDFRNPSCHKQFAITSGPGISEVICGQAELADALQTIPESDARILMAGQSNPQVAKSLSDGKFAAILKRLRNEFDCIIIDSAPTPVVSDGFLIGKVTDGVILVVRAKVSKGPTVFAAFEQLTALKIPTLGAVVNGNPAGASSYYA